MAELATIARPYAEALHRSSGDDGAALRSQLASLATVAANPQLRQFADNPKAVADEVYGLISGVAGGEIDPRVGNLLRTVIDNGRLSALPEIAAQYAALVNSGSGVSDATVFSAFPIDHAQLLDVSQALEKRYGRKLKVTVRTDPSLIGGIRAVVGDAVLDLSVKARLEQMKAALTA